MAYIGGGVSVGPWESLKKRTSRVADEKFTVPHITKDTRTTCFVLGSHLDPYKEETMTQGSNTTTAMTFETFFTRAERRMLNLWNSS